MTSFLLTPPESIATMTDRTDDHPPEDGRVAGDVELLGAERLIFFSDAVVAIAITLLALVLPVPHVGSGASNHDVLHGLWGYRDAYAAFLISFVVIAGHWRTHHRLFRAVTRLDAQLAAINMIWLLMIIITPFATRVLYGNGGFGVRFSLYAIIQVITLVAVWLMSRHIRASRLVRPGAHEPLSPLDDAVVLAVAAMFAISIPIAFVTQWAFAVWVAAALVIRWVRRLRRWLDH
jgi:uncharacterized membrane protein